VPRVWEKFEEKMKDMAASKPKFVQSISGWAKGLGATQVQADMKHKSGPLCFKVANFLILQRIKQALGLGETRIFIYGAAPLK
jgi:long-chain-fatty-acid--CoA ligase ACSBG